MYTWNKNWIVFAESPWGIINKFLFANSIHGLCAARILGSGKKKVIESSRSTNIGTGIVSNYDISGGEWLTNETTIEEYGHKLLAYLLEPMTSVVTRFYNQNMVCNLLIQKNLYYCPECMKSGLHYMYHQFVFVEECPIHKIKLQCTCPVCGQKIQYAIELSNNLLPYECKCCGHKLFNPKSFGEAIDIWNRNEDLSMYYMPNYSTNKLLIISNNIKENLKDSEIKNYLLSIYKKAKTTFKPKYVISKGYNWEYLSYSNKYIDCNRRHKASMVYYVFIYTYKYLYRHFSKTIGNRRVRSGIKYVRECCDMRRIIIYANREEQIIRYSDKYFDIDGVTFFLWRRDMECEDSSLKKFDISKSKYDFYHLDPDSNIIQYIENVLYLLPDDYDQNLLFNILVHISATLMIGTYKSLKSYVAYCKDTSKDKFELAEKLESTSFRGFPTFPPYNKEFLLTVDKNQELYKLYFSNT